MTAEALAEVLQVSVPTVKRDLRYMREVLGAPVVYNRRSGGYSYRTSGQALSVQRAPKTGILRESEGRWYNAKELYVLVKALGLLEELDSQTSSLIVDEIEPVKSRLKGLLGLGGLAPEALLERIRLADTQRVVDEGDVFEILGLALSERRRLQIAVKGQVSATTREVSPQRLVNYRGRWYLDTYCHQAKAWRTFAVDNVVRAALLPKSARHFSPVDVHRHLDGAYGLFRSGVLQKAVLHFDSYATPYVRRERWHAKQHLARAKGGGLRLTVPFRNPTELVGEILRWGDHVEVIEPKELREAVRHTLQKSLKRYE